METNDHWHDLADVRAEALVCCRCDLCRNRTLVVFGEGPSPTGMMIVGEGPGADEDRTGRPFVGRAGKLLDRVLESAGIRRDDVWVTNIVRCRPTALEGDVRKNRPPRADEVRACNLWMTQELRFVAPKVVVCLGTVPAQALISTRLRIGEARGLWHSGPGGVPTTVTYHPAYVFRLRGNDRIAIESTMVSDLKMAVDRSNEIGRAA